MYQDAFAPTEEERRRIDHFASKLKRSPFLTLDTSADLPLSLDSHSIEWLVISLNNIADRDWKARTVAAWMLGVSDLPLQKRGDVIASLRDLLQNRCKMKASLFGERLLTGYFRTFQFALPAVTFTIFLLAQDWDFGELSAGGKFLIKILLAIVGSAGLSGMVLPFAIPASLERSKMDNDEARMMAMKALLRQNALEAMSETLECAFDKSEGIRIQCRAALRHFLPQITEKNRTVMPLSSEHWIAKILDDTHDLVFREVIVDYLEKFGQGSSAKAVDCCRERLTQTLPYTEGMEVRSSTEQLLAKCERVLAILHERQNQNDARQELLRHSAAPIVHADQLLRSAADSQTTPTEQLLRASNSDN